MKVAYPSHSKARFLPQLTLPLSVCGVLFAVDFALAPDRLLKVAQKIHPSSFLFLCPSRHSMTDLSCAFAGKFAFHLKADTRQQMILYLTSQVRYSPQ
jgi:hypothetical protein